MSNDTAVCEIQDCTRRRKSKGLCNTHYERLRRTGTTDPRPIVDVCTVDGCDRPVDARSMCLMHYKRVRKNGSPHRVKYSKTCTVCGDKARCKGLCGKHYQRTKSTGSPKLRVHERKCELCSADFIGRLNAKWCDPCKPIGAREFQRAWYKANRDRVLECAKAYYASERGRAVRQEWMDENRNKVRLWALKRRATIREVTIGDVTPEGITSRWAYYGGKCWICGEPGEQTDHVKPLNKGGAHMLANLRPICRSCNSSKADRWPLVSLLELPRFKRVGIA